MVLSGAEVTCQTFRPVQRPSADNVQLPSLEQTQGGKSSIRVALPIVEGNVLEPATKKEDQGWTVIDWTSTPALPPPTFAHGTTS